MCTQPLGQPHRLSVPLMGLILRDAPRSMRVLPLRILPRSWLVLRSTCLLIRKNAHGARALLQNVGMVFI